MWYVLQAKVQNRHPPEGGSGNETRFTLDKLSYKHRIIMIVQLDQDALTTCSNTLPEKSIQVLYTSYS